MTDETLDSVGVAFFYQSELGGHPDIDIAIPTPSIRVNGRKHDGDRVRHIDHGSRFRNSAAAVVFLPDLETKSLEALGGFWREWFCCWWKVRRMTADFFPVPI
jgi:hypothetical protein